MDIEKLRRDIEDKDKQLTDLRTQNEKLINQLTLHGAQIEKLTSKINDLIALNQQFATKNTAQKRPHTSGKNTSSKNQKDNDVKKPKQRTADHMDIDNNSSSERETQQSSDLSDIDSNSNGYYEMDIPAQYEITNNKWSDVIINEKGNMGKKPTPIQLEKLTQEKSADTINKLFAKLNGQGYSWVQIKSNSSPRIQCDNTQTKDSVIKLLNENKIQHNTYAEKNQKKKAYIVRGLCHGFDENIELGIKDALNSIGIIDVYEIKRFQT